MSNRDAKLKYRAKESSKEIEKASRGLYDAANRERNRISLPVGSKRCSGCKIEKDFTEFHILLSAKDGRQTRCKACIADKTPEQIERQRETSNAWYADNKERHSSAGRIWHENNHEYVLEKHKEYRTANREIVRAGIISWKNRNRQRVYDNQKAWAKANPEKRAETVRKSRLKNPIDPVVRAFQNKAWRKANKAKVRVLDANKRARRRGAEGSHTEKEVSALFKAQKGKCANTVCRVSIKDGYHEDHIIPLIRGGTNFIRNIQLLCPSCNLKKHAKDPIEWAKHNGLLL